MSTEPAYLKDYPAGFFEQFASWQRNGAAFRKMPHARLCFRGTIRVGGRSSGEEKRSILRQEREAVNIR